MECNLRLESTGCDVCDGSTRATLSASLNKEDKPCHLLVSSKFDRQNGENGATEKKKDYIKSLQVEMGLK